MSTLLHNIYELANALEVSIETDGRRERDQQEIVKRISRCVYKGTDCGAWVAPIPKYAPVVYVWGVQIGSIVEGCDVGTATYSLRFPFTAKDFWDRVDAVEREAKDLWEWANGDQSEEIDAPDTALDFAHLNPDKI